VTEVDKIHVIRNLPILRMF